MAEDVSAHPEIELEQKYFDLAHDARAARRAALPQVPNQRGLAYGTPFAVGRTSITKYGTKRGAIALGRAFPFGIGAAIGGGANYLWARALVNRANSFFKLLAPDTGLVA
jgi:hypothetical protein